MGVQGLWELLSPVGCRVSVDTLGSKKLAVDASIWIIQFMKAMRDDKGDMIRNAHLLGFFRRICKLLYLRIKPVFVFDGATPALKRRTVLARRRQREKAQSKIRKTAEKLLLNHLRTRKLEEIASEVHLGQQSAKAKRVDKVDNTPVVIATSPGPTRSNPQVDLSSPSLPDNKYDREETDALLAASLAAEYGGNTQNGRESSGGSSGSDDDEDDEEQLILPAVKGLDPSVLASLPPSMQLDLLVQMREQLVAENRQKFQKVAKVPSSFSQMQIQAYLKTVAFRREINEVQKAAAGGGIGGVPTARVASTIDREFIFSKSFEGEKPAPSDIEEQRRSEQTTPPKTGQLQASFMRPSSVLFSSTKNTQEKEEDDGVISLVSTELKEETDSNSNSVVHTYIDERGHVRVNRRRGMGVRMTRDLQWNLYLMKDVEARKSLEISNGGTDPAIIPSTTVGRTPLPAADISHGSSITRQGLEISFVDDGGSDLSKDEDGDLFEELVMEGGEAKDDQASAIQGPLLVNCTADVVKSDAGMTKGGDEEDEEEWEDGGVDESRDGSVVEDRDLAEAVRLSLLYQNPGLHAKELSNQSLLEDGPSSGESEVEWEDGTGDVSVVGLDGATSTEDVTIGTSMPSEEAEFEEAIRRSLEDFCPPVKAVTQLVIKEPADNSSSSALQSLRVLSNPSPLRRAEAESEELYLARERTRKGKAVLAGDDGSVSTVGIRPRSAISEQEQIAALTLSEMPVIEATLQVPAGVTDNSSDKLDDVTQGSIDFRSIGIPVVAENGIENSQVGFPSNLKVEKGAVDGIKSSKITDTDAENFQIDLSTSLSDIPEVNPHPLQLDEPLRLRGADKPATNPSRESKELNGLEAAPRETVRRNEYDSAGLPGGVDGQAVYKASLHSSQLGPKADDDQEDLIREAEEIDIATEREELRRRESVLIVEREQLAREEAELQAELEVEQEEIRAGLDRERELLAQEEIELRAAQKKNERNADSVTGEMFAEVQELLQMFGVPYIIAPMEAEAQCAYMDTIELIDGVVTDDSDVFLFGGKTVYKNLFDDRKYVETYYTKDLESEMGMTRGKLIRIAMLLGSDYTEGISGIGIVNAIEVVNAFPEEDGLQTFKEWLDSPDHALFQKVQGHPHGKGKGSKRGENTAAEEFLDGDRALQAGDLDESADTKFTALQQVFMGKHRAVSKNWTIPDSFPSEAVVSAYIDPKVDKSTETFAWGRPDLDALRRFCNERFFWNKEKADELLLPVLKEYDRRETQTRLESFYQFNQRFAKIRSRRIQKAVTGMTGKRSAELMELPPHMITESPLKKTPKKRTNPSDSPLLGNEAANASYNQQSSSQADPSVVADTHHKGAGRGLRGRPRGGNKQKTQDVQLPETFAGHVGAQVSEGGGSRGGRGRSRARGRGRGRGRAAMEKEEASISSDSDSDDTMGDSIQGGDSFKRKPDDSQQPRRSTRQRSKVTTYRVDNSDEEAGGTCSDGEDMIKEVDMIVAEALRKKPQIAVSGVASIEIDQAINIGAQEKESTILENARVQTEMAGCSEISEFQTGGGFCPCEEEESGQQDMGFTEPAFFKTGGGFCLSEDECSPPATGNGGTDNAQSRHGDSLEGAPDLFEGDAKQLPAQEFNVTEGNARNHSQNLENESRELGRLLPDTSLSRDLIAGVSESSEPAELDLRAMPLMRRKRRTGS